MHHLYHLLSQPYLVFRGKVILKLKDFFEAFHALLAYLISFLACLIVLHFQVLSVSPVETHFAMILLFIRVTIAYSIAYVEIKLQPQDADLPIFRFICLISKSIAIELLVAIIISPFWLFMVNLCPILFVVVLHHSYQQIYKCLYNTTNLVLNAVRSLLKKIYQLVYQRYDWFLQKF